MPNINTDNIQGYSEMTAEQKIAALEGYEIPEAFDPSKWVSKEVFDRKATEAANLSKQLKNKPGDDELTNLRNELASTKETVSQLQREKTIADWTAKYLSLGYDAPLAKETAEAMQSGDMDKVFANGEKHRAALEAKIKADLMKSDPKPGGAGGDGKGTDSAVEKAKELAKARFGSNKSYDDIMNRYKK